MSKPLIDVPKEKLQQVRMDMFRKVQREKKIKKRIVSVTFIAILCLSLILSIRVSPTIASRVAKISGFQAIVSAIAIDKGIKDIVPKGEDFIEVTMNKDNQGKFLMFSDAIKEDGTMLEFKGISISRDEQYVVETTQFEEYNGRAKLYLNYYANPIGKNIELNIPLQ